MDLTEEGLLEMYAGRRHLRNVTHAGSIWDAPAGPYAEHCKDMVLERLFAALGIDPRQEGHVGVDIGTAQLAAASTSRYWRSVHDWHFVPLAGISSYWLNLMYSSICKRGETFM